MAREITRHAVKPYLQGFRIGVQQGAGIRDERGTVEFSIILAMENPRRLDQTKGS
jgi:hypothetical protein